MTDEVFNGVVSEVLYTSNNVNVSLNSVTTELFYFNSGANVNFNSIMVDVIYCLHVPESMRRRPIHITTE